MISKCHQAAVRLSMKGMVICSVCNEECEMYTQRDGLPPHGKSDTSIQAAREIMPHTGTLLRHVYDFILSRGSQGATDDEVVKELGMLDSTENARRGELEKINLVFRTDKRRKTRSGRNAIVFIAKVGD